jgi:hypothetical protein
MEKLSDLKVEYVHSGKINIDKEKADFSCFDYFSFIKLFYLLFLKHRVIKGPHSHLIDFIQLTH